MSKKTALGPWLEGLEARLESGEHDAWPVLAFVAGQAVRIDDDEKRAALRRAILLQATAGDPRRDLDLDGRAVTALAADLQSADRRTQLVTALLELREQAEGYPRVLEALGPLVADPELAWRAFACALVAEELAAE